MTIAPANDLSGNSLETWARTTQFSLSWIPDPPKLYEKKNVYCCFKPLPGDAYNQLKITNQ